jgi:hypothetical protein
MRAVSTLVKAEAIANPNAGTRRSPTRTKSGTRLTTPSGSARVSMWPTPFADCANPGSVPEYARACGRPGDAGEIGGHERC